MDLGTIVWQMRSGGLAIAAVATSFACGSASQMAGARSEEASISVDTAYEAAFGGEKNQYAGDFEFTSKPAIPGQFVGLV
jgi:hypothetical protein